MNTYATIIVICVAVFVGEFITRGDNALFMDELHLLGVVGLNIEGGFPRLDLQPSTAWGNLVITLDNPLESNITFDELQKDVRKNQFPFLENGLPEINEPQYLVAYLSIMGFIMHKYPDSIVVIQVHQAPIDANPLVEWLREEEKMLRASFVNLRNPKNLFLTDNPFYVRGSLYRVNNCKRCRVVISFSQCASVAHRLKPGNMSMPSTFIPYNIDNKTIHTQHAYSVNNILIDLLPNILSSDYHLYAQKRLKDYVSANRAKKHVARNLVTSDFLTNDVKFLHVSNLWNPTSKNESVHIEGNRNWKPFVAILLLLIPMVLIFVGFLSFFYKLYKPVK